MVRTKVAVAVTLATLAIAGCRSTTKGEPLTDAASDGTGSDGTGSDRPVGTDGASGPDGPDAPADTGGPGGVDGPAAADAGAEASSDAGTLMCGSTTCGPSQICVRECTCGGPLRCGPRPDGGTCPAGPCPGEPLTMCALACSNPPPTCRDLPAECNGTPSDACLAGKVCPGIRSGRQLDCVCPP